jgi:hypothetical protein
MAPDDDYPGSPTSTLGKRHQRAKVDLTEEQKRDIFLRWWARGKVVAIASDYGVTDGRVSQIGWEFVSEHREQFRIQPTDHPLPSAVESALLERHYKFQFYKAAVVWDITVVMLDDGRLNFKTRYTYEVFNPGSSPRRWPAEYNCDRSESVISKVTINGRDRTVQANNDESWTVRDRLRLLHKLGAGENAPVLFEVEERCGKADTMTYWTEDPTTDMKVTINYSGLQDLYRFDPQLLYFRPLDESEWPIKKESTKEGLIIAEFTGLLPFEGIRLEYYPQKEVKDVPKAAH